MSQSLSVAQTNSLAFGERKKTVKSKPALSVGLGRITWSFVLVALICAAGVFYIFTVNNSATYGYKVTSLEKQIQDLKEKNDSLKVEEAKLRSLNNIQEKTNELNMAAPKDVSYISLPGNVAMR